MGIGGKILNLKNTTKTKIENALKTNQTAIIVSAAKELDFLERLEKQFKEVKCNLEKFESQGKEIGTFDSFSIQEDVDNKKRSQDGKSYKQIGKEERQLFVKDAQKRGIGLTIEKGVVLYRNELGKLVGIAYASERPKTPNRWFLGLPNKKFHSIVLICKNEFSERKYFIFDSRFCQEYYSKFSLDKAGGQCKFSVSHNDGLYTLKIPNIEPIVINEYINKFKNISH